jgi:hypothetical protein
MNRFFILLFCVFTNVSMDRLVAQELSDFDKLRDMDGLYVVKVGSIFKDTPKDVQDKLYDLDNVIAVSNPDKTVDFVHHKAFALYENADSLKKSYISNGFAEAAIGFVFIDDYSVKIMVNDAEKELYTVSLGSFDSPASQSDVDKILSIPNVKSLEIKNPDKTLYVLGVYDNQNDAKNVVLQLLNQGIVAEVLRYEKGAMKDVNPTSLFTPEEILEISNQKNNPKEIKTDKVIYRVQIGAFAKKIPLSTFKGVNIILFKSPKGLNKYVSGSFLTYAQAFEYKKTLKAKGYSDAFIVAFKDGKTVKISDLVSKDEYLELEKKFPSK